MAATEWQAEAYENARIIDDEGEGLTQWEIDFIDGVVGSEARFISRRMAEIIDKIYGDRVQ